jgi:hypothetical protein
MSVRDGRLVLPDGMSYRVLVLPNRTSISLPVLRKLKQFVAAGATVLGPKPTQASGLQGYPNSDAEVGRLAAEIWARTNAIPQDSIPPTLHPATTPFPQSVGAGHVISGRTARDVLLAGGVPPDFECEFVDEPTTAVSDLHATRKTQHAADATRNTQHGPAPSEPSTALDFIHRTSDRAEIYFVANRSNVWQHLSCTFRVTGKAPELWDPVTGRHRFAAAYEEHDRLTTVPLEFAPCGSWFVVFREPAASHLATAQDNRLKLEPQDELTGAWTVAFNPKWGGPASANFEPLVSWTARTEPGIKYYSGTATYTKTFDLPAGPAAPGRRLWLDLGDVRELAEVRLNGKDLGVLWAPPFRVELTDAIKASGNSLEIEVVNFWPNRIIGDASLPEEQRLTRTNIRKLTKDTPLMESGLLGPVRLMEQQ